MWVFVRVYVVFFFGICTCMASVYSLHSILYTCHAANTHSLIHMNVCSTTTAAATRIKTITNAFYHSVSTNHQPPTISMSLNIVKLYAIITAPDCKLVHIPVRKKAAYSNARGEYEKPLWYFICVHLCLRLSAKVQPLCVSQTIVNNFSSAWIEDQYTHSPTNWHISKRLTHLRVFSQLNPVEIVRFRICAKKPCAILPRKCWDAKIRQMVKVSTNVLVHAI